MCSVLLAAISQVTPGMSICTVRYRREDIPSQTIDKIDAHCLYWVAKQSGHSLAAQAMPESSADDTLTCSYSYTTS